MCLPIEHGIAICFTLVSKHSGYFTPELLDSCQTLNPLHITVCSTTMLVVVFTKFRTYLLKLSSYVGREIPVILFKRNWLFPLPQILKSLRLLTVSVIRVQGGVLPLIFQNLFDFFSSFDALDLIRFNFEFTQLDIFVKNTLIIYIHFFKIFILI